MHTPPSFALSIDVARRFVSRRAFATLVCRAGDRLEATPVPTLLDGSDEASMILRFHLAKANPVAGALDGQIEALLVFSGPDAYVSPDWYATRSHPPTWNYVAAEARGVPEVLDDGALQQLLDDLSAAHETRLDKRPWTSAKIGEPALARLRAGIVGFRMPVQALAGKAKLSQNRTREDRDRVRAALSGSSDPMDQAAARWMEEID